MWREWATALPPHAGTSLLLARPPAGRPTVTVTVSWTGEPEEGEELLAPVRTAVRPRAASVGPAPSGTCAPPRPAARTARESSLLLDLLPAGGAEAVLHVLGGGLPRCVELRLLGGAVRWAPQVASAVGSRDAALAVRVIGGPGAEAVAATRASADELAAALGPAAGGRGPAHGRTANPESSPATTGPRRAPG